MNETDLNTLLPDDDNLQDESLDDILSQFVEAEADLYDDISALAQKYEVDVSDLPALSETEQIVKRYQDDSFYEEDFIGDPEPKAEYDEDGRRIIYDESSIKNRGSLRPENDIGDGGGLADEGSFSDLASGFDYGQDDWRSPKKGRWKNRRKARVIHEHKEKKPFFLIRILRFFLPWKGDSPSLAASKVLLMTFFSVLAISIAGLAYSYYTDYFHPIIPTPTEVQTDINGEVIDARQKYSDIDFPEGLIDEFVDLYALNTDFVGYLSIYGADGNLQAPVVQAEDNNFYANHNFYKNESWLGSPFLDYNNDISVMNANTVIYANNLTKAFKSTAFSEYKKLETFKEQPLVTYWSRQGVYYWKIYAVFVTNARADQDNGYIFYFNTLNFPEEDSFEGYKAMLDQKKLYLTGVDLKFGDRLLTISAYDDELDGAYTVMVARLVREGEPLDVDVSLARVRDNPRYPQLWYDKKRKDNPYKDAENWQP